MTPPTTQLVEIGQGVFACLQPDGSWGLSNAGLLVGTEDRLLVDTFFDVARTADMLTRFREASQFDPVASVVVNTHANGDHCYGNVLLADRRIVASAEARRELLEMPAAKFHRLMQAARLLVRLGRGRRVLRGAMRLLGLPVGADFVDAAPYVLSIFDRFELEGIELTPPNETFTGQLEIQLGERTIDLLELGPAHTAGDVVVFDRLSRTLFAGDLLFMGSHPLAWSGTPHSCITALNRLKQLEPAVIVPGHGPITDQQGINEHIAYYESLRQEARPLHASGLPAEEAAKQLMAKGFGSRSLPERLYVNVEAAYREFAPTRKRVSALRAMGAMSRLAGMA